MTIATIREARGRIIALCPLANNVKYVEYVACQQGLKLGGSHQISDLVPLV